MAASSIVPSAASETAAPAARPPSRRPGVRPSRRRCPSGGGSGSGARRAARAARPRSRTGRGGTRPWPRMRSPAGPRITASAREDVADGGEVLGRVRLAERAADGAAVAHDGVGDDPLGVVRRSGTARRPRRTPAAWCGGSARRPAATSPSRRMKSSSARSLMSISHSGRASRSFIIGSRLCPPAMTRDSGPWRSSRASALSTVVART